MNQGPGLIAHGPLGPLFGLGVVTGTDFNGNPGQGPRGLVCGWHGVQRTDITLNVAQSIRTIQPSDQFSFGNGIPSGARDQITGPERPQSFDGGRTKQRVEDIAERVAAGSPWTGSGPHRTHLPPAGPQDWPASEARNEGGWQGSLRAVIARRAIPRSGRGGPGSVQVRTGVDRVAGDGQGSTFIQGARRPGPCLGHGHGPVQAGVPLPRLSRPMGTFIHPEA